MISRTSRCGFTLAESIVSLAMAAMVMMVVASLFTMARRSAVAEDARGHVVESLAHVGGIVCDDLEQAVVGGGSDVTVAQGAVSFTRVSPYNPASARWLSKVTYNWDPETRVLTRSALWTNIQISSSVSAFACTRLDGGAVEVKMSIAEGQYESSMTQIVRPKLGRVQGASEW